MEKLKTTWVFLGILILLICILSVALYYLKGTLPSDAKDFTSDIIAVLALAISVGLPLYKELFPKKLLREYHVSPLLLVLYTGDKIYIKCRITNSGEVDVNVQFEWVDFRNERYVLYRTEDEKKERIDSSIFLPSGTQKDFYVDFQHQGNDSITYHEYAEAGHRKDARLIEHFRNIQGKLTWSDVSPKMQQTSIPLGAWLIEYLKKRSTIHLVRNYG